MMARGESKVLGRRRKQEHNTREKSKVLGKRRKQEHDTRGKLKVLGKRWKYFEETQADSTRGESKVLGKKRKYFEERQVNNTELLPGLSDDVTVQFICTKLPWRTFHVLSSVSTAWLGAIRSGQINDTRVRSRTAETLALVQCFDDARRRNRIMALYSLRDKAVNPLPTLPHSFRQSAAYVAIGGKVYILGTMGTEVWVLDVAGQKKWEQCASMLTFRVSVRCSVFEGKIYVFGGFNSRRQPVEFSEAYDPKVDAWTKISQMKSVRVDYNTCVVRDEILVHSGFVYDTDYPFHYLGDYWRPTFHYFGDYWRPTEGSRDGIEASNPAKDSWRTLSPEDFGNYELVPIFSEPEVLFTAQGRLHCLSQRKIDYINLDKKSVKGLHIVKYRSNICHPVIPDAVLATNDGFLTKGHFAGSLPVNTCTLFQSPEPVIGKKRLKLEEVECSPSVSFVSYSKLEPIEL